MFKRVISYLCLLMLLISATALGGCGKVPKELIGSWEHSGHIYKYTVGGLLFYDGDRMYYRVLGDGRLEITGGGERRLLLDYALNPDGSMTLNGVNFFPLR